MSRIFNNLILGSFEESFDSPYGFTHVLNVANECEVSERVDKVYKKCAINDDCSNDDISDILPECIQFIKTAHETSGIVFVHCWAGKSRSACVVLAYMVKVLGLSFDNAYEYLKRKRDIDIYELYLAQTRKYLRT